MLTITPYLTQAIALAETRSSVPFDLLTASNAPSLTVGGLTILVLIFGLIFMAAAAHAIRDLASVIAQLVRSAATIGSALVVIAFVVVTVIALLLHH